QPNWRTGSAATWCARCTRAGNGSAEAAGAAAGSTKNGSPAWRGFRIGLAAGAPAQSAFATTFLTALRAGALADALAALATGAAAGLGHGLRTRIAVTGDVALALGRLAVALAHRLAPGSLKNRRKDVRPVGPPRGGARWRILPCGRLPPRRASLQCVQLASWTWPWFRRRFTRCPSPTRVPPKVIATACGTTVSCRGA